MDALDAKIIATRLQAYRARAQLARARAAGVCARAASARARAVVLRARHRHVVGRPSVTAHQTAAPWPRGRTVDRMRHPWTEGVILVRTRHASLAGMLLRLRRSPWSAILPRLTGLG